MLNKIKNAIENNLAWFIRSGVMSPNDGSWGVAERIVMTCDNAAMQKIRTCFPFHTAGDGYIIIENRRPDCCFQSALMFHMAAEFLETSQYLDISRNILNYLYHRSGSIKTENGTISPGIWRWSHCDWQPSCWVDDNAWCITIPLIIAGRDAKLDEKFGLTVNAIKTLDSFKKLLPQIIDQKVEVGGMQIGGKRIDGHLIAGDFAQPHWGSLFCMALAAGYHATGNKIYRDELGQYADYMESHRNSFNYSEHAYHAMAFALAGRWADEKYYAPACKSADHLIAKMKANGAIASQHHETPAGENYVDLIYTQNWAMLAFLLLDRFTREEKYRTAYEKCAELILPMQVSSQDSYLNGCWRGLFDCATNSYSGGDCYEGGANSIYTGWTNAPICIALMLN